MGCLSKTMGISWRLAPRCWCTHSGWSLTAIAVVLTMLTAACYVDDEVSTLERRAQQLNTAIMCPVCPGESIDQSQNPLAMQMRNVVVEKLAQGWTDDQVSNFFVDRYGPSVLLEPQKKGVALAVWVIPPVAVSGAVLALYLTLRVMRRRSSPVEGETTAPTPSLDPEMAYYYRRIQEAIGSEWSEAQ